MTHMVLSTLGTTDFCVGVCCCATEGNPAKIMKKNKMTLFYLSYTRLELLPGLYASSLQQPLRPSLCTHCHAQYARVEAWQLCSLANAWKNNYLELDAELAAYGTR